LVRFVCIRQFVFTLFGNVCALAAISVSINRVAAWTGWCTATEPVKDFLQILLTGEYICSMRQLPQQLSFSEKPILLLFSFPKEQNVCYLIIQRMAHTWNQRQFTLQNMFFS
jgi:hypothetical protein